VSGSEERGGSTRLFVSNDSLYPSRQFQGMASLGTASQQLSQQQQLLMQQLNYPPQTQERLRQIIGNSLHLSTL